MMVDCQTATLSGFTVRHFAHDHAIMYMYILSCLFSELNVYSLSIILAAKIGPLENFPLHNITKHNTI